MVLQQLMHLSDASHVSNPLDATPWQNCVALFCSSPTLSCFPSRSSKIRPIYFCCLGQPSNFQSYVQFGCPSGCCTLFNQRSCLANRYFSCPQLQIARKHRAHVSAFLVATTRQLTKLRKWRALVCVRLTATAQRPRHTFCHTMDTHWGRLAKISPTAATACVRVPHGDSSASLRKTGQVGNWQYLLGMREPRYSACPSILMYNNYHFQKKN